MKFEDLKDMLLKLKHLPENQQRELMKDVRGVLEFDFQNIIQKIIISTGSNPAELPNIAQELAINTMVGFAIQQKLQENKAQKENENETKNNKRDTLGTCRGKYPDNSNIPLGWSVWSFEN